MEEEVIFGGDHRGLDEINDEIRADIPNVGRGQIVRGGGEHAAEPEVADKFQQARLDFQARIDDRQFDHDQALDRRDEIVNVIPPNLEQVEDDADSMERTLQGIRDRNAESDEDRKLREDAEAFMAPGKPAEVEAPIPPPPPELDSELASMEGRINALEDLEEKNVTLEDLDTTGASIAERGYNIGKGTVGAANYSASMGGYNATGTFDLDVLDAEMNEDIIDVDLANDRIIVKRYYSGVYNVSMLCEAEINLPSSGAGSGQAKVAVKKDGVSAFEWSFMIGSNSAATSATYHKHSSGASKMIYVDASAADVDFTADWSVATVAGGPQVIRLKQLSVELLHLAQSATEI